MRLTDRAAYAVRGMVQAGIDDIRLLIDRGRGALVAEGESVAIEYDPENGWGVSSEDYPIAHTCATLDDAIEFVAELHGEVLL